MRRVLLIGTTLVLATLGIIAAFNPARQKMGPQPDGTFIVSSGQRVLPGTISFGQRLSDIALHPDGTTVAVVAKSKVFLVRGREAVPGSSVDIGASAGFHGAVWVDDGKRLIVSTDAGHLQSFDYKDGVLTKGAKIELKEPGGKLNPVPGGMCVDKKRGVLYVTCANENKVKMVELSSGRVMGFMATDNLPFTCRLTDDGDSLIVSNWGGELPGDSDLQDESANLKIKVTKEGSAATGTVTVIGLGENLSRETVKVGIHPTGIATKGSRAYVANAQSDSISVIDLRNPARMIATWPMTFQGKSILGAMPNELTIVGDKLLACNGGDNAVCVISMKTGKVEGYHPAGYFPTGIQVTPDGRTAYVVNTKGNGSVRVSTTGGTRRNAHDFQGTVSVVDLNTDLKADSEKVAELNSWNTKVSAYEPKLKVYKGAIKHVIYVIKENRTYDEVFGDMKEGDGDASFCSLGETVMPNHRKIARTFCLFDNAYVSGTNSADGHQWCDQSMANEYLEHFYVGYSRTYPDDGEDAMALNSSGRIWDAAMKAGKSVRVYGEWAGDDQATYEPRQPKDWFEAWDDRQSGRNMFKYKAHTRVNSLKPILCPDYHYWPLIQSDQSRIDVFEREFKSFVAKGTLPNLIVMSLPSDHGEGTNPAYPTPRSMQADNDLALGRLVDIVSHSAVWKDTCIFVTEDDAQGGPDHVDGHRSVMLVASPYTKRGQVVGEFMTQVNMLKSIETMLGFKPMTKFDTIARPITECFTDTPDLAAYTAAANNVPLGERNPSKSQMTALDKYWYDKTMSLDWSSMDRADFYWVNRINWYSIYKGSRPYPDRPWDEPGHVDTD
ncbi:MAG: hypothetical protein JSS66_02825 [Armatimonadetes bacterium]|nr:hypothetical protein [Armatimonadota bacterium]